MPGVIHEFHGAQRLFSGAQLHEPDGGGEVFEIGGFAQQDPRFTEP
jgi:hypothetical protein